MMWNSIDRFDRPPEMNSTCTGRLGVQYPRDRIENVFVWTQPSAGLDKSKLMTCVFSTGEVWQM